MSIRVLLTLIRCCVVPVLFLALSVATTGCSEDDSPSQTALDKQAAEETDTQLRSTDWRVTEFEILVRQPGLPSPALAFAADESGLVQAGVYDATMVLPRSDLDVLLRFKDAGLIEENIDGAGFEDLGSTFKVLDGQQMRLRVHDGSRARYDYNYDAELESMLLTTDAASATSTIDRMSNCVSTVIFSGVIDEVTEGVAQRLVDNPAVREAVNKFLFDLIRGKLDTINELDPEEVADELAQIIVDAINGADLEPVIAGALEPALEKLTDIDAEAVAAELAADIAADVAGRFSKEEISAFLLPLFERRDLEDPEVRAEEIAQVAFFLIEYLLDEETLSEAIEQRLEEFINLTPEQVDAAADDLATVVEDKWLNVENLAAVILPFAEQLEATPIPGLPGMASDITDEIEIIIGNINARFPDLGLAPNFDTIQSVVLVALAAAKPVVGVIGPEQAAEDIATAILGALNHEFLTGAFATAITTMQTSIDPARAADSVATWLVTVVEEAEPAIVDAIAEALAPILAEIDAQNTADAVGAVISTKITDVLSEDALFELTLPLTTKLTLLDAELLAAALAEIIVESGLIPEFDGEQLGPALVPIVEQLVDVDVDAISQGLVDALLDSGLVDALITEDRVARILNLALYSALIRRGQDLQDIEGVEFVIETV